MKKAFFYWLTTCVLLSGVVLFAYIAVQQNIRQSANDPQIQIAEDAANLLGNGESVDTIVQRGEGLDIAKSLSLFVIVYDSTGFPLGSSAKIGNLIPVPPKGVFEYTSSHGQDRITWEPETNVRIATVVQGYTNGTSTGFVLVGRSLREAEKREEELFRYASLTIIIIALVTFVSALILFK